MKISGRKLSQEIYGSITAKITHLAGIIPHLVIITSSPSDAVKNYVKQKIKKGTQIGVNVEVVDLEPDTLHNREAIVMLVKKMNARSDVHGIIFQKPSHPIIDDSMEQLIDPIKDVDGFLANSNHKSPIYRAVLRILREVFTIKFNGTQFSDEEFFAHLNTYTTTIIGKGKTGGRPVIEGLIADSYSKDKLHIIDSKTSTLDRETYVRESDIIISAVGKPQVIDPRFFSSRTILIDMGVHFDASNMIQGDYQENGIKDIVGFYTTTPGGVGALTVAYLMDNTVNATMEMGKNKQ